MVCAERTDKMHPMAQSFVEAKSAFDEVFRFYKWRRHAKGSGEEVYPLLSRCAYVCFFLWKSDQESQGDFFHRSPPPTALWIGVDFEELRACERKGPVFPADRRGEHLANNTQWFEFWIKILEQSDPRGTAMYREFSHQVLACAGRGNWLEVRTGYRSRRALDLFLKKDEAGRVLLRTLSLLGDLIQSILRYFATLDGRTCVREKLALLTGLLGEMRQIIVWETPASGPYTPAGDTLWRVRSPLTWLSRDRTQGVLTVIPRREGGEILCIYSLPTGPKGRRSSWARQITSLKRTYEEMLFATWSYETGEHRENAQQFPGVTACWTVQYAESQRLETLARQVELLLASLQGNPLWRSLIVAVRGVLRNGSPRWKPTSLPWTYVHQLDQLLERLTQVYREASVLGGDDTAERVVAQHWASEETAAERADSSPGRHDQGGAPPRGAASSDMAVALSQVKFVLPKADPDALPKPSQPSGSPEQASPGPAPQEDNPAAPTAPAPVETTGAEPPETSESAGGDFGTESPAPPEGSPATLGPETRAGTTVEQPEQPESTGEDSRAEDPARVNEENPASATPGAMDPPRQPLLAEATPAAQATVTEAAPVVVPAAPEEPAPKPARARKMANESRRGDMSDTLLLKLLDHHVSPEGARDHAALSAAELQRDLGWNQSQIQRAMTSLFGPKPFGAYKKKCEDGTIAAFLRARAVDLGCVRSS